jgi:hypothetical protein
MFGKLQASVSVYNLFNKRYADPAGDELRQDSILQDGRNFRVKLAYKFQTCPCCDTNARPMKLASEFEKRSKHKHMPLGKTTMPDATP